jgi:hypothetical protein
MATPMLCIEGTVSTNTVTGQVYNCVGRFVCDHCAKVSTILEFSDRCMTAWESIECLACERPTFKLAQYGNQARFVPLIDPDRLEQDALLQDELVFGGES